VTSRCPDDLRAQLVRGGADATRSLQGQKGTLVIRSGKHSRFSSAGNHFEGQRR